MLSALLLISLAQRNYRQDFPLPSLKYGEGLGFSLGARELPAGDEAALKASGARWVRLDFLAGSEVAVADRRLSQVRRLGMRAVCRLVPGGVQYAAFAKSMAVRYRRRGIVWEISAPRDAAKLATAAIREVSPEEWIVGPAIAEDGKAGLFAQYDALSVQPSPRTDPESVIEEYALLRRSIRDASGKDLPLVCTGWDNSSLRNYLANLAAGVPLSIGAAWPPSGLEWWKAADQRLRGWQFRKQMVLDGRELGTIFTDGTQPAVVRWNPKDVGAAPTVTSLAKRDPVVDLALTLPTPPASITWQSPADVARLVRSFAASLPAGGKLSLEWRMPLLGRRRQVFTQGVDEIEAFTRKLSEAFVRMDPATMLRLTVTRPDGVSASMETLLLPADPLTAALDPTERGLYLTVTGRAGSYSGTARVVVNGDEREVVVELKTGETTVFLPGIKPDSQLTLVLKEGARVVLLTETARFAYVELPELTGGSVQLETTLGLPLDRIRGPIRQVTASFPGSAVLTPASPILLPGKPSRLIAWVHGDASGVLFAVRLFNAKGGQIDLPSVPVDWKGWRRLAFNLPPGLATPLQLGSPLVLSSAKPMKASIGFGGFHVELPIDGGE
jgi:hypothetical protein